MEKSDQIQELLSSIHKRLVDWADMSGFDVNYARLRKAADAIETAIELVNKVDPLAAEDVK